MTIYAVGNEEDSFHRATMNTDWFRTSPADARDANQTFSFQPTHAARGFLNIPSVSECWVHFKLDPGSGSDSTAPIVGCWNRATGRYAFMLTITDITSNWTVRYNSSGSTMTEAARRNFNLQGDNHIWDVYFKRGASGIVRVFQNHALVWEVSGDFSTTDSTWDTMVFAGNDSNGVSFGSVIVSDTPCFKHQLDTMLPDGAGTTNGWTGAYTDIDDATGYADRADAIFTDTPSAAFTFNYAAAAALPSSMFDIKGLMVASIGSITTGAAVSDVELYMRHSGTNYTYDSLGFVAGDGDFGGQQIFATDPLGAAWTTTTLGALEIGAIAS